MEAACLRVTRRIRVPDLTGKASEYLDRTAYWLVIDQEGPRCSFFKLGFGGYGATLEILSGAIVDEGRSEIAHCCLSFSGSVLH